MMKKNWNNYWMNLTNSIDSIIKCLVVALLIFWAVPTLAQQSAFDDLTGKFQQGMVFHASFSHKYTDSYTGDTQSNEGVIWVGENKYKVRTTNQSVVVDGETSKVYDDGRNRVIISNYEPMEDDFAPSRMLNGIDSTYSINREKHENERIIVSLVSEDPFSVFKEVEITLTDAHLPLRIFAVDHADNEIITTFEGGSFINPEKNIFSIDYPQGAEIIDMRN